MKNLEISLMTRLALLRLQSRLIGDSHPLEWIVNVMMVARSPG
jgi:hypothetical protein